MADFFESYGGLLISLLVLGAVEAASRSGEAGCRSLQNWEQLSTSIHVMLSLNPGAEPDRRLNF